MPYIVRPPRLRGVLGVMSAAILIAAAPAQAGKSTSTQTKEITSPSQCVEPTLTQAFLYAGDTNLYTLAPGQVPDNFAGTGWVLSGGASIKRTTLEDGSTGNVLDMPSGSQAV